MAGYKRPSDWVRRAPVDEVITVIVSAGPERAAEIASGVITRLGAGMGMRAETIIERIQQDPAGSLSKLLSAFDSGS